MGKTVRAGALANYPAVARGFALDVAPTLRKFGLDPRILDQPDLRVPAASVAALLEYSAVKSECPTFGLRMAELRQVSDFGAVSLLLTHERSLRDVLDALVRYRNFLNEALVLKVESYGEVVVVREDLIVEGLGYARQSYELALGVLYRMCSAVLGARWRPLSVHFSHKRPESLSVHRRVVGADCVFGEEFNGILCRAADLDQPNPAADPKLAHYAAQFIQSLPRSSDKTIEQDTLHAIKTLLPLQKATIVGVAETLGVHVRTLQRRLEGEGVQFGDLLNKARKELARRYVVDADYSLTNTAALLGYAQLSSFSRWFTSEFGVSPTEWRKRP